VIVVFDSGVWISAFHFGGIPLKAIQRAFIGEQIAYCDEILYEVADVLTRKFKWLSTEIESTLDEFLSEAICVTITGDIRGVCRDPKDDMIFECAVAASAKFIISGDQDLLVVGSFNGIEVLTPRKFLDLV
jgi:uncharacterized protein